METAFTPLRLFIILIYSGNRGFLTSGGSQIKNGSLANELVDSIHLQSTLGTFKVPGYSILDSEEAKDNNLAEQSLRTTAFICQNQGPHSQH